ncbi:SGNH/GDSL hydrolase family protein [Leekyejoonella antrihumi]|uniref:SGNH/GDSL hydrolase family protein n=1 Tax=Leekyejoonella antrihumi TaxID=1660198 RepID=A0A563E5W6_9MICO|nr:GDSL-type esterase/lipase family protein [Leekyejoonella antrihumi]TWP37612.1 SGNH/GDSL hydrolase family protein [Leekyejoonella antrihumi]
MRVPHPRRTRRTVLAVVSAGALVLGASAPSLAATTHHSSPPQHQGSNAQRPVVPGSDYLALGDSVAFGYREATTFPPPNYTDPTSFVGYPAEIGSAFGLHVTNASCPGETSGSFVSTANPSYACETPAGYRTNLPLHVTYRNSSESQLTFAVDYLKRHHNTRLITLGIGANDGFLCDANNGGTCTGPALAATLKGITTNVRTILFNLRYRAHYFGQIVIVDYYSLDYASAAANANSQGLNQAMASAAKPFGVKIADEYAAYQNAALHSGGDSCAAGLLTQLFPNQTSTASGAQDGCGVHPTVAGQDVLAHTIEATVRKAHS